MTDPDVDAYVERSDTWPDELRAIRPVLLDAGLTEGIKWRQPCFTHEGRNIAILQEMKDCLYLMFFKGGLLKDPEGVLEDVGPNSRKARRIPFTSTDDVARLADTVTAYVAEAIDVEDAGLEFEPGPEVELAAELQEALDRDPELKAAFEGLTPGRQREYNLHIAAAKKAETRLARVDKLAPRILEGKGLRDG
ncbi:MAG TPA: YdeI/OmpD-associated family protein [Acidimicrobiales bacterium]|nr:YdeI/OmpD-associated family protein [Acidimicrobiales bacterium]